MANRVRWSEAETKRALYLYFQMPFGQIHSGNPEIIALAQRIGRTPSSVAMKLANFASLDPAITRTGRKGLEGASALDRAVWSEFTGIADPRLLNASHIAPWKSDIANRHNPRNGLCLSATFDRAFDRYLMTVTPDLEVLISKQLLQSASKATRDYFTPYHGRALREATHLAPDPAFLRRHNEQFLS